MNTAMLGVETYAFVFATHIGFVTGCINLGKMKYAEERVIAYYLFDVTYDQCP